MGMSNRIGRKITTNTCICLVAGDGAKDVQEVTVTVYGNYKTEDSLQNACRKRLGNKRLLLKSVSKTQLYYSMPAETFMQYADKITDAAFDDSETEEE